MRCFYIYIILKRTVDYKRKFLLSSKFYFFFLKWIYYYLFFSNVSAQRWNRFCSCQKKSFIILNWKEYLTAPLLISLTVCACASVTWSSAQAQSVLVTLAHAQSRIRYVSSSTMQIIFNFKIIPYCKLEKCFTTVNR